MLHFVYEFICIFLRTMKQLFSDWMGRYVCFHRQQKSDNKNIWTASLIVSLQLLWKKMMCRQTVLSVCTCLIYFYVEICYADSTDFFPTSCKGFLRREQLKYRSCENDCLIWISLCANVHVLCKRECSCLIIKQFELRRFDL